MTYNQSKIRTRLMDTSSILYLHDTVLSDPQKSVPSSLTLKVMIPHSLHDKMTMSKQVCVIFDGSRYHGEVTKVIFHDVHVSCGLH